MTSSITTRTLALTPATTSSLLLVGAAARAADVQHVRRTIASVDGAKITIKENDGKQVAFTFGDDWKLAGIGPASLTDVKQGTYTGTANVEGADGNKALEVVIFPDAMRGPGNGNYGWDLSPTWRPAHRAASRDWRSVKANLAASHSSGNRCRRKGGMRARRSCDRRTSRSGHMLSVLLTRTGSAGSGVAALNRPRSQM